MTARSDRATKTEFWFIVSMCTLSLFISGYFGHLARELSKENTFFETVLFMLGVGAAIFGLDLLRRGWVLFSVHKNYEESAWASFFASAFLSFVVFLTNNYEDAIVAKIPYLVLIYSLVLAVIQCARSVLRFKAQRSF